MSNRGVWWTKGTVLALALSVAVPSPAGASHTPAVTATAATSPCSWMWADRAGDPILDVRIDPANTFPPDRVVDGHNNSFFSRVSDSVSKWNTALLGSFGAMGMAYRGVSSTVRDINVQYVAQASLLDPEIFGNTRVRVRLQFVGEPLFFPCLGGEVSPPSPLTDANFDIMQADIAIRFSEVWFTQADSRRAAWESCSAGGLALLSYACQKPIDFGSTLMHEFTHAVGLVHPEDVRPDFAEFAILDAHCGETAIRATVCPGPLAYRSERRTLDTYDTFSLNFHQANN